MIRLVSHKFADIPAAADDVWELVEDFVND